MPGHQARGGSRGVKRRSGSGAGLVAFSVEGSKVKSVADDLTRVGVIHRWLSPNPGAEMFRLYVLAVPAGRQAAKAVLASTHELSPMEERLFRAVRTLLAGRMV